MAVDDFIYNAEHGVAICRQCKTCLIPDGPREWTTHLRREPHRLKGDRLQGVLDMLSTYDLRGRDELQRQRPNRRKPCQSVDGLKIYPGYICTNDRQGCVFVTRRLAAMHDHMPRHGKTASQHSKDASLWESCTLQTYFTATRLIDYFVVVERKQETQGLSSTPFCEQFVGAPPSSPERYLLNSVKKDLRQAVYDMEAKSAVVEDLGRRRDDRERWLIQTGFPTHLQGLRDTEIKSSYALPKKNDPLLTRSSHRENICDDDNDLYRILSATDSWLRKAYDLVADRSLERKMTQQRAQTLSDFASGASKKGRDVAFRCFKNEPTLVTYFRRMKELLVYYYRVVYQEGGHFSRETKEQVLPQDVIKTTRRQRDAIEEIYQALHREDERKGKDANDVDDYNEELESAIRKFYVSLICHTVGSAHFRSPVISFCAMLSRTKTFRSGACKSEIIDKTTGRGTGDNALDELTRRQKDQFGWHDPGNYSGNLSALIWTAQLVLFEAVCFYKREVEEEIPATLTRICEDFMHQKGETVFGYILQWRLYITTVARSAITRHQARWSLDGQELGYLGINLRINQLSNLIVSEYRRARTLLFDTLLFGAKDIAPVEAWRLHDDLDSEEYGSSWLTDGRNESILDGTQDALLRQIEGRADLRRLFIRDHQDGEKRLCQQAMAAYEADVQEFLKSLLTPLFISPMPPLRAPEFLSITLANSGSRRRSTLIWEKMLMVHVRYRKSSEQTGSDGDNIRFIPSAVAELLLTYQAIVQPLRLAFLRQVTPGALLTPYLFSKIDGMVWHDETVSKCLSRACARAKVPEFKVAWWRQAAASITKEKFSPKERANFNMEDIHAPEEAIEEEELLVDMAEGSNHSFRTFNHAYAGSTTLTMSTMLHRAYRASLSWRTLFGVDELLAREKAAIGGKRPLSTTESVIESSYRKIRLRTRPSRPEMDLEAVARGLYNDPNLVFRRPGQRDAILATLGPHAAEQVVVVLGTGSGKTLLVMIAAALEGANTTILILPTVALRVNMMDRFGKADIKAKVWTPGESGTAPLVVVSAEAACTRSFLEYAHRLESRQRLDRIVVDECHLTITATYRRSMVQLASFIRQLRTQSVWLTATLPLDFEEIFTRHNLLVRPRIIRESTNRSNIRYRIQCYQGLGKLCHRVADLVRSVLSKMGFSSETMLLSAEEKSRLIVYCPTLDILGELADELGCHKYIGDPTIMSIEDKEAALSRWLGPTGSPVIVATSALGVGFDYPHVRWVIHAGAPRLMTEFSQESGRAGRDGRQAESIIVLSAAWKPPKPANIDQEYMNLYLTRQYCLRAVMSQFLDRAQDWRWCMKDEDELCGVCPQHNIERRASGVQVGPRVQSELQPCGASEISSARAGATQEVIEYTGPDEVLRRTAANDEILSRFEANLETMRGCCLLCRIEVGRSFDHSPGKCQRRWPWIKAKARVIEACEADGKPWMARYTACFACYLPQTICNRADPEVNGGLEGSDERHEECRYRDMIMPLCYGAFYRHGPRALIKKHFPRPFRDIDDYMRWLGQSTDLAGVLCIQAIRVAEMLLSELNP